MFGGGGGGGVYVCVCVGGVCVCVGGGGGQGGGGVEGRLNQFYLRKTSPISLMQFQITSIYVRSAYGSFTLSVKHHTEIHIIANSVMN